MSPGASPIDQDEYAARALLAYRAMRRRFGRRDGLYRPTGRRYWPRAPEHLWPFSRALISALDLTGAPLAHDAGRETAAEVDLHLTALEHYWDPRGPSPAYASDPPGTPFGADRYYDDNAWVGLALIQAVRLGRGNQLLPRAEELWRFARAGWDERADVPLPGGVFWVEQGRGTGRRNHDRNTVSTAPNAQLALHLSALQDETDQGPGMVAEARRMNRWVEESLRAPTGRAGEGGLYWDKVRGDGTIDRALWSYNQGNMIGLNLLLARAGVSPREHLRRAEQLADLALHHYAGRWFEQPAAFNAILARNLLGLHRATGVEPLRERIIEAVRDYAEQAWRRRDDDGVVHLSPRPSLLAQSAVVSLLALLAWYPTEYDRLA